MVAFSAADQLRRQPAPVNSSMRRAGSGMAIRSEIDMCRSPTPGPDNHSSHRRQKGDLETLLTFHLQPGLYDAAQRLTDVEFDRLWRTDWQ